MVDIAANLGTTANLAVGGSLHHSLEANFDVDWIRINLIQGQTYTFLLAGDGLNEVGGAGQNGGDTLLSLLDNNGAFLTQDDDGGLGWSSQLQVTASRTGIYYLDVRSFDGMQTGDYLVSVNSMVQLPGSPGVFRPLFNYTQIANQLTNGYWRNDPALEPSRSFNVGADKSITVDLSTLDADSKALARAALQVWKDIIGVSFVEVAANAEIKFDDNGETPGQPEAFENEVLNGHVTVSANVVIDREWMDSEGTTLNSYTYQTYVHEIGHALGLGHGGLYNSSADWVADTRYANDSWQATVMSYFDTDDNTYINATKVFVMTPQIADIIAIQSLYGAATNTRSGNTVYGFNNNTGNVFYSPTFMSTTSMTIYDTAGVDTLDVSGFNMNQTINLNPAGISSIGGKVGNIMIAHNAFIENAFGGGGNDTMTGNVLNNTLSGLNGNDTMNGGDGNDTLVGGAGNDTLNGQIGNDTLIGGAGTDTLNGSVGNDIYNLGAEATGVDTIVESTGLDTILSTIARNISGLGLIENVVLQGAANIAVTGNSAANGLQGNSGNNTIAGGLGNDSLNGGAGNDLLFGQGNQDSLVGGLGNDTLVYQTMTDSIAGPNCDFVADFNDFGNDTIDVRNVSGAILLFKGTDPFTGINQLRIHDVAGPNIVVAINLDADLLPEMQIVLKNTAAVTAADFLL